MPSTLNNEGKTTELKIHHGEFSKQYPTLFEMIVKNGSIDRNILEYMLNVRANMTDNGESNTSAEALVGQKLFDQFVKPIVDSNPTP